MKVKIMNPETLPRSSTRETTPYVRLHFQGVITISTGTCKLLSITKGDGIIFIQDEDNPEDWYLAKSKDGYKATGKGKDKDKTPFTLNHQGVRRAILISAKLSLTERSIKLKVANIPTQIGDIIAHAILTASGKK